MINKLKNWGCDVDEALDRFVGDQDLYLTCFNMFLADSTFDALKTAIDNNDVKAGFEACHTLKGVGGNLSAGPLYHAISELTEKLRQGNMDNAMADYEKIIKLKEEVTNLLN